MESGSLEEITNRSNKEGSFNLSSSLTGLKCTKSLDKSSSRGSLKKGTIQFKESPQETDNQKLPIDNTSIKVPHKIITNWRSACDKTKDKTKDLLKRWRTLPEIETENLKKNHEEVSEISEEKHHESGWSIHEWTTWVDRFSIDSGENETNESYILTSTQKMKFTHFFNCLLDHDQDNLICEQDFEVLIERLRHFADWSQNSTEFNILKEVESGFISTFFTNISDDTMGYELNETTYLTNNGWLMKWAQLLKGSKNLNDFPIWLQFFIKVLFQVINRGGTGMITRNELSNFYSSVLCLNSAKVDEILDIAFYAMTSNGDHPLHYRSFTLCFSNYLLGRYPNGSGHYILGAPPNENISTMFPLDYSALNTQPEDLEQYTPDQKSNRRSIIV